MTKDPILLRLRGYVAASDLTGNGHSQICCDVKAAADEIERLRKIEVAARDLSGSLEVGFVRCRRCGDQEDTTDLDFAPELRAALG